MNQHRPFAVNGRYRRRPTTGVQRYAAEILASLGDKAVVLEPPRGSEAGFRGYAWEQCLLPAAARERSLWSPCNVGPIFAERHAVTIHDVSPLDHPEWFSDRYVRAMRLLIPMLVRRARHIFTVSEFSRQRLIALFGLPEERVTITYNGVRTLDISEDDVDSGLHEMGISPNSPFLLSVGSREPRKNLAGVIDAYSHWDTANDVQLVVVGDVGSPRVFANSHQLVTTPGVRFLGRVSDIQLAQLYRRARACVFAPLYEGFGLPAIEALAYGTPVIASNIPPLHEACDRYATFVDPASRAELMQAMSYSMTADALDRDQVEAHLLKFSWAASAEVVAAHMERL